MGNIRKLKLAGEIINAWQSSAAATGAGDIFARYYRLEKNCDPRIPDPCNNYVYLITSYISVILSLTHGVFHTLVDLPTLRRSENLSRKADKIFKAWNISTDLVGKYSYITQNLFFLYTVGQLGKFDPFDTKEVNAPDGWKGGFGIIATALALLCNTHSRAKLRFNDDSPQIRYKIINKLFDFIFEGINGYLSGRAVIATIQNIHDLSSANSSWHNSWDGFHGRMYGGLGWGVMNGTLSAIFKPEFTVADMFGIKTSDGFNKLQKFTSSLNSLFNAIVFGVFTGIQISNNESTHKNIELSLLTLLAVYIPIYYILIRCCYDDNGHGYAALPDGGDGPTPGNQADIQTQLDRQKPSYQHVQQKLAVRTWSNCSLSETLDKDLMPWLKTHALIKNSFFNTKKIKSQDRKALAIMRTRRKNLPNNSPHL